MDTGSGQVDLDSAYTGRAIADSQQERVVTEEVEGGIPGRRDREGPVSPYEVGLSPGSGWPGSSLHQTSPVF